MDPTKITPLLAQPKETDHLDPVCGMKVSPEETDLQTSYQGMELA